MPSGRPGVRDGGVRYDCHRGTYLLFQAGRKSGVRRFFFFFFPSEALFYPGLELPSAAARGPVTLPSRRDASCFQKFTGEGLSVLMGRETHGFFGGAGNKVP